MNKKSIEALVNSGALDDFGERSAMYLNVEDILSYQRQIHDTHAGQNSLFGEIEEVSDLKLKKVEILSRTEKLKLERELLGLYLSGHPLDIWRDMLRNRKINVTRINKEIAADQMVDFAGIVTNVKTMLTKKKDKMAFVQVADLDDEIEVVVFPKSYELYKEKIVLDTPLLFRGRVSLKNKGQDEAQEKKLNDDGTEAKSYGNKAIILEEIIKI
jgi:DNA polymerase-3 subunit alpha